ncbi:MAG: class I SAM-dependent methyltransferase [Actinomycetota bacterium]|nr:class I SAM-dependent methyltransferase [Actinomycetota bacterium]
MGPTTASNPNRFARDLFAGLPARYDRLVELLSLGQNRRWRQEMVDHILLGMASPVTVDPKGSEPPSRAATPAANSAPRRARILDVATGTAGVAIQLARRSGAGVVGVDLSVEMLGRGADNVAALTSPAGGYAARSAPEHPPLASGDVTLTVGRAERLPFPDQSFDALAFTYLLRYVGDVGATLRELARVVRPGAPVASLDFAVPGKAFWRLWWWGYTRLVLPVAGALTGGRHWYEVGRFLGPNISRFYRCHPVSSLVAEWQAAGFEHIGVRAMSLGGGVVMWGRRAGD